MYILPLISFLVDAGKEKGASQTPVGHASRAQVEMHSRTPVNNDDVKQNISCF